jgi:cell division protein ZapA
MATAPATRVEIYGQGYSIGGDSDAAYVQRLAERVDAQMRSIGRQTSADSLRVAVLAALNLADENERLRAELARLGRQSAERTHRLLTSLDQALR